MSCFYNRTANRADIGEIHIKDPLNNGWKQWDSGHVAGNTHYPKCVSGKTHNEQSCPGFYIVQEGHTEIQAHHISNWQVWCECPLCGAVAYISEIPEKKDGEI